MNEPTPETPRRYECPSCNGDGRECRACEGRGWFAVDRCPYLYTGNVADALRAADLAEHGMLPEPGGWLNQCESGMRAIHRVWAEQDRAEAQRIEAMSNG